MTPEQELADALAESRELEQAVVEAFGLEAVATMYINHIGLVVKFADGSRSTFPSADWTPAQEESVRGLYKHFHRRHMTSMPDQAYFTWEQP